MNRAIFVTICSMSIALAALPGALGAWSGAGSIEPDYAKDVTDGLMFSGPDVNPDDGVRQVYFNVVKTPAWSGVNPNVGATGSHTGTHVVAAPQAFLGVWKDCNADGYIGHAESAVTEYASLLLPNEDVCPDGGTFNNDGWVYEFLWIIDGNAEREVDHPARYFNDTSVKVWGDSGLPPQAPPGAGGSDGGCFTNFARGTFSSTGGMIDWADCLTGRALANAVNENDPTEGQLAFDDPSNPQCSDSLLNQRLGLWDPAPECPERFEGYVGLLKDYEQEHATWGVWDCSGNDRLQVEDPTTPGEFLVDTPIPTGVSPRLGEVPGSVYDGVNETYAACDPDASAPDANQESDVEQADAKVSSDYVLQYNSPYMTSNLRQGKFCGLVATNNVAPIPDTPATPGGCTPKTLSDQTPQWGGARAWIYMAGIGPMYASSVGSTPSNPFPNVELRDDGSIDGEGPAYDTYYASVSTSLGLAFPGGGGQYLAEWCGDDYSTDRVLEGVDCNADHWYNPLYGASAADVDGNGRVIAAFPGETYNLRDTDCYDGSVAGQYAPGVGVGLTLLDAQPDSEGRRTGPCDQS